MTCIAGIISKDGKAHIACDSQGSNGHTKDQYTNQKIFKKGAMLIGYSSSYRMGQLLQYSLVLPKRAVGQSLDEYMYVKFAGSVRTLFKENGYLEIDKNREKAGTFLVIYEGRIFTMQDDMAMLESSTYFDSVGSGEYHAKAAIDVLLRHSRLSVKAILLEAIAVAGRHVTSVGGETRYLSQ